MPLSRMLGLSTQMARTPCVPHRAAPRCLAGAGRSAAGAVQIRSLGVEKEGSLHICSCPPPTPATSLNPGRRWRRRKWRNWPTIGWSGWQWKQFFFIDDICKQLTLNWYSGVVWKETCNKDIIVQIILCERSWAPTKWAKRYLWSGVLFLWQGESNCLSLTSKMPFPVTIIGVSSASLLDWGPNLEVPIPGSICISLAKGASNVLWSMPVTMHWLCWGRANLTPGPNMSGQNGQHLAALYNGKPVWGGES